MNFAAHYFRRYKALPRFFDDHPAEDVGMIVIIPCLDDAFVFRTLQSLEDTTPVGTGVEVIVNVNSGEDAPAETIARNREIYERLMNDARSGRFVRFRLLPLLIEGTPRKRAGVGLARKTAMDEAVRRFDRLGNPDGLIVSLDADTLVAKSYFQKLEEATQHPSAQCFTLQFKHRFDTSLYPPEVIEACKKYEIYLRYYRLALKSFDFPFAIHTIGSCFAIRAGAYVKLGGMTPRQGGEDFYFLQKAVKMHPVFEIREPIVFPSPRISNRVPFGTGPSVRHIVENGRYSVYHRELFGLLKTFYNLFPALAHDDAKERIPSLILDYIGAEAFDQTLSECRKYSSSSTAFVKRMYHRFDAFFVVKFLNSFDNSDTYAPVDVMEAAKETLRFYGIHEVHDVYEQIFELDLHR